MEKIKSDFEHWLWLCMHDKVGDHVAQMASFRPVNVIQAKQLEWFDKQDWVAICNYEGKWCKSASLRLLDEAPEDIVKSYCVYRVPLDDEQQVVLVNRDIRDKSHLSRSYFGAYCACEQAQRLIKSYDHELWHWVLLRNYGWEWKFEQKFGSLAAWQKKLEAHYDELTNCQFEDVSKLVDAIE